MNIVARLREFTTADFVLSYFAKFSLGLGLGIFFPERQIFFGAFFILLAVLVGFRAELKFWSSRN